MDRGPVVCTAETPHLTNTLKLAFLASGDSLNFFSLRCLRLRDNDYFFSVSFPRAYSRFDSRSLDYSFLALLLSESPSAASGSDSLSSEPILVLISHRL